MANVQQANKADMASSIEEENAAFGTSSTDTVASKMAWFAVIVAALGYFVDVFDMWLFANFRVTSLKDLGLGADQVTTVGAMLINCQQFGLLLGGFCWGMLGDKRGRASVMFASIILYSLANLANAFVTSVPQYAVLRFITGFGLAGEIGAGITLIAELLPKAQRGYGTTIVTGLGVSGAIAAAYAGSHMEWRHAYLLGGVMGLALLLLRYLVHESGMYSKMKHDDGISRGSLKLLFGSRNRVARYICCVLLGVPIYLCFAIFAAFSPEIATAIGISGVQVPEVMLYASIGITIGDVGAGLLSQLLQSRRKPIAMFVFFGFLSSLYVALGYPTSGHAYSLAVGVVGIFSGYWACLITATAEQFGTNLRATVTTTVPNVVRASAIILTSSFIWLKPALGVQTAVLIIALGTYVVTAVALLYLKESFHRDLDFYEHH